MECCSVCERAEWWGMLWNSSKKRLRLGWLTTRIILLVEFIFALGNPNPFCSQRPCGGASGHALTTEYRIPPRKFNNSKLLVSSYFSVSATILIFVETAQSFNKSSKRRKTRENLLEPRGERFFRQNENEGFKRVPRSGKRLLSLANTWKTSRNYVFRGNWETFSRCHFIPPISLH